MNINKDDEKCDGNKQQHRLLNGYRTKRNPRSFDDPIVSRASPACDLNTSNDETATFTVPSSKFHFVETGHNICQTTITHIPDSYQVKTLKDSNQVNGKPCISGRATRKIALFPP